MFDQPRRGATCLTCFDLRFSCCFGGSTCFPGVLQSLTQQQKLRIQQIYSSFCMVLFEPLNPHSCVAFCYVQDCTSLKFLRFRLRVAGGPPAQTQNRGQCLETWCAVSCSSDLAAVSMAKLAA